MLSELQHIAAPEGLDATMAYSLGEDRDGRLWIGSGSGLRIVSGDPTVAVDRFTARDGISGDDATAMAFWLDDDDGLWFGSSGGLTHIAAERYHGPPTPPTVRLLGLVVGARVMLAEHGAGPAAGGDHDLRAEDVPLVLADPGRLTQVIINLLINASHALPPGAADRNQITVRTRTDLADGHAILEVEDHGVGMAPDVVAHAFDPFFTTKRIGEGTGLGLSICHGIITGLGGQISIDSQLGRGTTVRISLPPSPTARGAPTPEPAPAVVIDTSGRPRVLVVDDEPAVGNVRRRMLRTDCDVTVLTGGEDALRRVASGERFDVIGTDVMMR